jgi:hypothetical protein
VAPRIENYGRRDVIRDERTGAQVCVAEPEEAALFEDAMLAPRPAPPLLAITVEKFSSPTQ